MKTLGLASFILFLVASSATPSRGATRQDVLDDGLTWFEAVNGEALGPNNIPVSTGWYLKINLRVFGEYPGRSAFKVVVSKTGKPIATTRCETSRYSNTTGAPDLRLNGPSTSLFYGQPWTSAEGKALAAKVPKKGNPFPVPSNSPNAVKQWWEN